jgi:transposase
MTIQPEKEAEILRLLSVEHWPRGTIARHLRVHHDVVDRVARTAGLVPKEDHVRPKAIDPYVPFIRETLERYPDLNAARIFDMIRARGFSGSERRARAAVQALRPVRPRRSFQLVEVLAGEQSQIDWAHLGRFPVDGALRPVSVFVICLSWSRAFWAEIVLELSSASLLRSLVRAARYFGGTTRQWVFDNTKAVVIDRVGDHVRFNPELLELAAELHVLPKVCTPRRANEKGRVERIIRYLRERHFAARAFTNVDAGNRELLQFIEAISLEREHPDNKAHTVRQMLDLERPKLLALPPQMPSTTRPIGATVDAYGFVRFETNFYAAPGLHGSQVQLVVDDRHVKICRGSELVAEYRRWYGRRRRIGLEHLDRVESALGRDRRARTGKSRLVAATPLMISLLDTWLDEGHNLGSQVARALKILELYGPGIFAAAVEELAKRRSCDLGALSNLCEMRRRALNRPAPSELKLGPHVPDRDVELRRLEDYDE